MSLQASSSSASKTFKGDAEWLYVLNEMVVDLDNILHNGFDLKTLVTFQGWEYYFQMLHGPCYDNLVKDFWVNASVHSDGDEETEIRSVVLGTPVVITQSLLADVIKCPNDGVKINNFNYRSPYNALINKKLFVNLDNIESSSNLHPISKAWYKLIVSNILPRDTTLDRLSWDDKHLIFFLLGRHKVNLPFTIFNYLKIRLISSRSGNFFYIPYGRVLSELFIQEGLVEKLRRDLASSCGPRFDGLSLLNLELINQTELRSPEQAREPEIRTQDQGGSENPASKKRKS